MTPRENYMFVPTETARGWFPDRNMNAVIDACFKYIESHPQFFDEVGDLKVDNMEITDLVVSAADLGLVDAPEGLSVGFLDRHIGTFVPKGQEGHVFKNNVVVGTADEVTHTVLGVLHDFFNRPKTPRDRAEERRKARKKAKRGKTPVKTKKVFRDLHVCNDPHCDHHHHHEVPAHEPEAGGISEDFELLPRVAGPGVSPDSQG